jgi:hypothetical protein
MQESSAMRTDGSPAPFDLAPVGDCREVASLDGGAITSKAGARLLGRFAVPQNVPKLL